MKTALLAFAIGLMGIPGAVHAEGCAIGTGATPDYCVEYDSKDAGYLHEVLQKECERFDPIRNLKKTWVKSCDSGRFGCRYEGGFPNDMLISSTWWYANDSEAAVRKICADNEMKFVIR